MALLDLLWRHFPDDRQPQLLHGLVSGVKEQQQKQFVSAVAEALPLEERQAVVEKLLRRLQPHEMEQFVSFLPWVWGDDTPSHTAALYSALGAPERVRYDRMVEFGTIEPVKSRPPPAVSQSAASTAVAASAAPQSTALDATTQTELELGDVSNAASADMPTQSSPSIPLARDNPAEVPLEETPVAQIEPWKGMSPSEGGAPYTFEVFLLVSADCYEAALQSMLDTAKRANWAKSVFNVLLKRAGDAKRTGKKTDKKHKRKDKGGSGVEGSPTKSSMQMAREALFALLRAAQVLAPEHPRAMLFARLCGVYGAKLSDARTERVLRLLSNLFPENTRCVRDEMAKEATAVPLHGMHANISLVLRTMQEEIGAEDEAAIMAVIDSAAHPDPEPDAASDDRAVSLDDALLATIERHDAQRAVSQHNLRGVFAHFDINGDGSLDLPEFSGLMEACDQSLSDDQVSSMFLDCAKASKKMDDSLDGDEVNADAFVEVCEIYGLHMQVQSTVVARKRSA